MAKKGIPATAGKVLSEDELRTYMRCSKFYSFGGIDKPDFSTQLVQSTVEKMSAMVIREQVENPFEVLTKALIDSASEINREFNLLESEYEREVSKAAQWMRHFFDFFPFKIYTPIYGAFPYRVTISKTPIDLRVSTLYLSSKNQTLHSVNFIPYVDSHSKLNDPITQLKLHTLKHFVKRHFKNRAQARMHIFSISEMGNFDYATYDSNQSNTKVVRQIEALVKQMESGYAMPLLSCKHKCQFKSKCLIG